MNETYAAKILFEKLPVNLLARNKAAWAFPPNRWRMLERVQGAKQILELKTD